MAKSSERKSRDKKRGKRTEGELSALSAFEATQELAAYYARNRDSEEELLMFLKSWWSKHYNRPLKDPVLESYTLYELLYEYHDKVERAVAAEEVLELETDKIEEAQEKDTLDWIEEEERREREAAEKAEAEQKAKDEAWMVEQLKKEHGDDFGDDISTDFEG